MRGGLLLGTLAATAVAQSPPLEPRPGLEARLGPLVARYCADCHGEATAEAGLNLTALMGASAAGDASHRWRRVRQRLAQGDMPPPEAPALPDDLRQQALEGLDAELAGPDCTGPIAPGRPTLRRLSRREYANSVRDLLGVDWAAEELLPADELGHGFDNNGDVLSLSPLLLEKYLSAADAAAMQAIVAPEQVDAPLHGFDWQALSGGDAARGGVRGLYLAGAVEASVDLAAEGTYVVRFIAHATRGGSEPARMELRWDGQTVAAFAVEAAASDPQTYAAVVRAAAGSHRLAAHFVNDYWNPFDRDAPGDRNLFVHGAEVVGPLSGSADAPPLAALVGAGPSRDAWRDSEAWRGAARLAVTRLLRRAFRGPVAAEEAARYLDLAAAARLRGDSWERALQLVLRAVLVSPRFLFRGEEAEASGGARLLDEFELAARLSYFLWSSLPDEELLAAAEARGLRRNLDAQLARMLADPRSDRLARDFGEQWLETRRLSALERDAALFPHFDEPLRDALRTEAWWLVRDALRNPQPLASLLRSDHVHVNRRLAEHYQIALSDAEPTPAAATPPLPSAPSPTRRDVSADAAFRRVAAPPHRRAGILTLGGVLAVTSHGDRTSPTLRGKWILERLLNEPPPPPPPNVPALPPATADAAAASTLRTRLAAHVADPGCAACHRHMDPLGLALENYDAVGAWRAQEGEAAINASGALPDGRRFAGAEGLRDLLLADFARFRRTLAEQLLAYALGRGLEAGDACAVEEITLAAVHRGDTLPALIRAVVCSAPFQQIGEVAP